MTQLSRERAELKSFITGFLTDPAHDNQSINSMTTKVFRIALTALDTEAQEPVAYIFKHPAGRLFWALTDESNKGQAEVMPVYAEPQPVAVPDGKPSFGAMMRALDAFYADEDVPENAMLAAFKILVADVHAQAAQQQEVNFTETVGGQ